MTELEQYANALPDGLASYPEVRCKGSLIRETVDARRLAPREIDALPPTIRGYFEDPPLVSTWYPEVHLVGVMLAHFEPVFGGNEAAFARWFYDLATQLFAKPLYRILMLLSSPERLATGVAKRWGAFHQGSTLHVLEHGKGRLVLELFMPPRVYCPLVYPTTAQALMALIDGCGGQSSKATYAERSTGLRIDITWV